jgi:hypothetical protein
VGAEGRPPPADRRVAALARRGQPLIYLAPAEFRLGEIFGRQGDTAAARTHYSRFLDIWRRPEPELAGWVREARARLAALPTFPGRS